MGRTGPGPGEAPQRSDGAHRAVGVSVYGGYFGAAAGVLLLAGLPLSLLAGNALKNVLLGCRTRSLRPASPGSGRCGGGRCPPLAAGVLVGSWLGPAVARRLPETALRVGSAVAGLGLAGALTVGAY